jgi:hypothetical protein
MTNGKEYYVLGSVTETRHITVIDVGDVTGREANVATAAFMSIFKTSRGETGSGTSVNALLHRHLIGGDWSSGVIRKDTIAFPMSIGQEYSIEGVE